MNRRSIPENLSGERLHFGYMDFARAFLLSLGLLLHAAWLCRDRGGIFQEMFDLIHSFRMEGFFLIAGFFAALSLSRMSPSRFLLRRLERLGVPWLFCLVAFTGVAVFLKHLHWTELGAEVHRPGIGSVEVPSHLWFLEVLLIQMLLLFLLHKAWPELDQRVKALRLTPLTFLLAMVGLRFVSVHWTYPLHMTHWQFPHLVSHFDNVVQYSPWVAAGYIFFHHQRIFDALLSRPVLHCCNVAAFLLAKPFLLHLGGGRYLVQAWDGAYVLSMCGLVLWCSRRFFAHSHPFVRSLSDASYTIYLLHWPVMALCYKLLFLPWSPTALLFCSLIVFAGVSSYYTHTKLLNRRPTWAWLLNGKPMPDGKPWLYLLPLVTRHRNSV